MQTLFWNKTFTRIRQFAEENNFMKTNIINQRLDAVNCSKANAVAVVFLGQTI
jgi:hypothetical protein